MCTCTCTCLHTYTNTHTHGLHMRIAHNTKRVLGPKQKTLWLMSSWRCEIYFFVIIWLMRVSLRVYLCVCVCERTHACKLFLQVFFVCISLRLLNSGPGTHTCIKPKVVPFSDHKARLLLPHTDYLPLRDTQAGFYDSGCISCLP